MAIGEKLRGEREARNITIDQISAATGIGRAYLEDLERDAFKALPGRAKFYIRAYAQTLGFDPQKMIDQYDREQEALRPGQAGPAEPERAAPRPVEAAIARWRKTALAAHGKPDAAATDNFDDDDLDDEPFGETDLDERKPRAPITLPSPGLMQALAGTADEEAQVERPVAAPRLMHAEPPVAMRGIARAADPSPAPPVVQAPATTPTIPVIARVEREIIPPAAVYMPRERERRALAPPSLARVAASVLLGIVVVFAGIRLVFFKTNADGGEPAAHVAAAPALPSPVPAPPRNEPEPEPEKKTPETPKRIVAQPPIEKATEMPSAAGALTVIESGIGRRIVDHRLADTADTFAPGDVVWFSTHVTGGRSGQGIRHLWIHEGRPQQSIPLRLAGPDYRTHSRKTIYAEGTWTVEARDGQGEVLASATFECVRPD